MTEAYLSEGFMAKYPALSEWINGRGRIDFGLIEDDEHLEHVARRSFLRVIDNNGSVVWHGIEHYASLESAFSEAEKEVGRWLVMAARQPFERPARHPRDLAVVAETRIDLSEVVNRLSGACRKALEEAARIGMDYTHRSIQPTHLLRSLVDTRDSDFSHIRVHFNIDDTDLVERLNLRLEEYYRGYELTPGFSKPLRRILGKSLQLSALESEIPFVRSGHFLRALMSDVDAVRALGSAADIIRRIPTEVLTREFTSITANSSEATESRKVSKGGTTGHVFVSYSRADLELVQDFASGLQERGVSLWLDDLNLTPSANWDLTIDQAIQSCQAFLVVLSPSAVSSSEVQSELRMALDEKKPLVPVMLAECRIPRYLRQIQYVDLRHGDLISPIATRITIEERIPKVVEALKVAIGGRE